MKKSEVPPQFGSLKIAIPFAGYFLEIYAKMILVSIVDGLLLNTNLV